MSTNTLIPEAVVIWGQKVTFVYEKFVISLLILYSEKCNVQIQTLKFAGPGGQESLK